MPSEYEGISTTITSLSFPFLFDFPALDLRDASEIIDAGVPGGKNGVLSKTRGQHGP